ncbi:MAG: DinB family protein [Candidatus Pristimantibacillus lignocellulolyticus]|uniref:DinB family protein n=1 Tax=Candidatus Pristimantibacillus lignocellulolyticus TaxID=2994561 RepID=A0A9J6ZKV1_9BACL|nr:MAG: DinB family protein [Candidatus Pristimantibacillus lignocellulolyticus]
MIHDLRGEDNMSPIVGMLYSAVKENSDRLSLITKGMTQEELDYKGPNDKFNSTAQLLRHIMYVDLNWTYRFRALPLSQLLIEQYGPMIDTNNRLPMIQGMSLNTLMSDYENVITMLRDTCIQLMDADLDKFVTFGHEDEKQATIRWGLWHMADHNRYHQAHINQLRKWYKEIRGNNN